MGNPRGYAVWPRPSAFPLRNCPRVALPREGTPRKTLFVDETKSSGSDRSSNLAVGLPPVMPGLSTPLIDPSQRTIGEPSYRDRVVEAADKHDARAQYAI